MPEGTAGSPGPRLETLEDAYELVGQLRGSANTRRYLGRRREDRAQVVITIVTPPAGGQGNELSHYAADAQLLAGERHPHLVDVLETRWLDGGSLALITRRVNGTTLGDLLEREERLSNPRAAAILQDVASVLDWARGRGVVHRGVSADGLFFEETSQRVLVALLPTLIPITGVPDACGDARTIGELAWSMLAGRPFTREAYVPLAEIEPGVAGRVTDATDRMLNCRSAEDAPDVPTMIGIIAAGDVLKQAEVEISAMKEEYEEQHRAELASCENRRIEVEQNAAEAAMALADERREFERQSAQEKAALAEERADFDRITAERQDQLAHVRKTLEQQAAELEHRLADFDERRSEFEQMVLERQRDAAAAGKAPDFALTSTTDRHAAPKEIRRAFAPLDAPASPQKSDKSRRRWLIPLGAVAVAAAVAAAVIGIRFHRNVPAGDTVAVGKSTVIPTAPKIAGGTGLARSGFLTQTVGGAVERKGLAWPGARRDSVPASTPVDTSPAEPPPKPRPRPRPEATGIETDGGGGRSLAAPASNARPAAREPSSTDSPRDIVEPRARDTVRRGDTLFIRGGITWRPRVPTDTGIDRESFAKPDSVTRRDIIGRPDRVRIRPLR